MTAFLKAIITLMYMYLCVVYVYVYVYFYSKYINIYFDSKYRIILKILLHKYPPKIEVYFCGTDYQDWDYWVKEYVYFISVSKLLTIQVNDSDSHE